MRKLTWAALTDVGMKRTGNEDAYIVAEDVGLYVVCDGMGGHASGEVASQMTTEEIVAFVRSWEGGDFPYQAPDASTDPERLLSNAIQHANDKVYVAGMRDPKLEGMGTPVVAVYDDDDDLVLGHVGDSRIYRLRDGELEQLTRDHSLLNHKIDTGEIRTQEEKKAFKHGNIIVRAIGLKDYVRPEMATTDRRHGDVLLLCSDGLTDLVDDWAIENVLEANRDDLSEAATILVRMANDRGGKDNITVMLIRVDDDDELGYGDDDFLDEATVPQGIDLEDDDRTDPSRGAFDLDALEDDPLDDLPAEDDKTQPHRPVFMWEDLGDDEPARRAVDDRTTTRLDGRATRDELRRERRGGRRRPTEPLPSIIVEEEPDDLPSIIIDDGLE